MLTAIHMTHLPYVAANAAVRTAAPARTPRLFSSAPRAFSSLMPPEGFCF